MISASPLNVRESHWFHYFEGHVDYYNISPAGKSNYPLAMVQRKDSKVQRRRAGEKAQESER